MKHIKILFLLYLFTFFIQCTAQQNAVKESKEDTAYTIAEMVIKNLEKLNNRSIAVIEFTEIDGKPVKSGKILAERIITYLAQHKDVKVVERNKVNKILEEQKLSLTGLTDSITAKKIGKILNVDALLTGTIIPVKNYIEINARMINTENALILSAIKVNDKSNSGAAVVSGDSNIAVAEIQTAEKKPADLPRVEAIEYKIIKIADGLGKNYSTIKITGKALFMQSAEKEKFKDLIGRPVFFLLDSSGNKVIEFKGGFKCGEYGNEENILPQKPFPFVAEDGLVKKELWNNIAACQFIKWNFVK